MSRLMSKVLLLVVLVGLFGMACAQSTTPVPATTLGEKARIEIARSPWKHEWDKVVAEAKKEGQVIVASSAGPLIRDALGKAFTGKYGVSLELISGKPAELAPKFQAERRAGVYSVDVFMGGAGTMVAALGPEGALEPLDAVLLLPEVIDKAAWWGREIVWMDTGHLQVAFLAFPTQILTVNADLVKSEEIKSFRDLLNPKWKGKISFLDPTMAGGGNSFFVFMAEASFGLDYLRELGKQEPVFTRDGRLQAEWLVRGKYPVTIGLKPESVTEFLKAGAPIKVNPVIEGTYVNNAGGGVSLINKAPHTNAAVVFINWLLSREGQTVASKAWGAQSARVDVPTDFLEPYTVRQEGVKYYSLIGERAGTMMIDYMTTAREMYGHLLK